MKLLDYYYVKEIPSNTAFGKKVERNLGRNLKGIESEIKSTYNFAYASGLQFKYDNYSVVVRIENSDNTGNKGNRGAFPITSY